MIDKLPTGNIEKLETKPEVNLQEVLKDAYVNTDADLERPPVAISIGTHRFRDEVYPTHFGTYGNFSCLVGASKSKKTFLKSALLAGYIGGQAQNYFPEIRGHGTKDKIVLDIDTEQSPWDVQRVSKRVLHMVGAKYTNYESYALRTYPSAVRMDFIEFLVNKVHAGRVGILSIDGAADLLEDVNDLKESNSIVQRLMKLSAESGCHIMTIIHRNHGTDKPTGHLGSAILKKAETVCFVEKDEHLTRVSAKHTRSMPFEDFSFRINENGLPTQENQDAWM